MKHLCRWPACLAVVLMLTGCSSIYQLVIGNSTGHAILVTATAYLNGVDGKDTRVIEVQPGQSANGPAWFYSMPKSIEVEVKNGAAVTVKSFLPRSYPDAMRNESSMGCPIHLDITESGMKLSGPSPADQAGRNPMLVFAGLCLFVPVFVLVMGGLAWRLTRPIRK